MFYGRLRFNVFLLYMLSFFFMFSLFYLYIVRNDDNKDDQSILKIQSKLSS